MSIWAGYEAKLELHFMRIVNMWRGGMNDDEVRVTAGFCTLPEWLILRIGRDMGVLTPEQHVRYDRLIAMLNERDAQ